MSGLPSRQQAFISSCHHAGREEYAQFLQAHIPNCGYRKQLLKYQSRFVRHYPNLPDWFKAPLIERVGRKYGESKNRASHPVSYLARHYLKFLALSGYAQFDWEWIIALEQVGLGTMLDYDQGAAGLNQLIEEAVQLGYRRKNIREVLQGGIDRIFLHTAHPDVTAIREADIAELEEATLRFAERKDLALFFGSVEHYQDVARTRLRHLYTLRVVLYHRGQVPTEPHMVHRYTQSPRPVIRPRMEAVVNRYLAAQRLKDRPSTIRHVDATLRQLIVWLAQTYPQLDSFSEVTREHILAYAEALNTKQNPRTKMPLASSTKRVILSTLSTFFEEIAQGQWEDAPSRPLLYAGDLPKRPMHVPRYIPEEELAPLMEEIRHLPCPYQRAALLIARWSGARRGEIRRLSVDCLDAYPDGTPRLHIPIGKTNTERLIPLHEEAAEAIRTLQATRKRARGLRDEATGILTHYLFVHQGRLLSAEYLFQDPLHKLSLAVGLITPDGKPTITAHRFRHTVGTQLASRGAKLHTVMRILGHQSFQMAVVYAHLNDQEVLKDYQAVLGPGAMIAGPAAEALRSGELSAATVDWLKSNFFKTELELGHCLRTPQEGPCECDLYLTCTKFVTTPAYAPRLRRRWRQEQELVEDALAHGWQREVERHQRTIRRIEYLLADLGEPIEGPEAEA